MVVVKPLGDVLPIRLVVVDKEEPLWAFDLAARERRETLREAMAYVKSCFGCVVRDQDCLGKEG